MPTEQEAKPAVVTPSLQQWRSPSTFRGAPGEDPLKWLKRASTQSYIQSVLGLCQEVNPLMKEDEKVSHLMKGVAEDIYQALQIVQDEVERVLAPVSTKPTETRPRPKYAAVTRKYRAPVQKFPPEPRKTDRRLSLTTRNRRRNFDDVGTEEEIRRPNSSRRFTPSPTRGRSQYVVTDPRRHIADPVSRQAVGARKTKESDLPRSRFWGIVFVISDKYRRFLKKVLFADAKSIMLKVADGNFVRPIGKCVLRVRINNRELPFEFIVLSHCSHDVILGWDFLEASQAVIDCGQNELVP
ncbi:transposon Ty3-I Gag-Pol polyprotein [Trichonephila clavipes]|nr:transposon Ty3-I Gag-Pol polyprotein [Trichonephila clavipes]